MVAHQRADPRNEGVHRALAIPNNGGFLVSKGQTKRAVQTLNDDNHRVLHECDGCGPRRAADVEEDVVGMNVASHLWMRSDVPLYFPQEITFQLPCGRFRASNNPARGPKRLGHDLAQRNDARPSVR